MKKIILCLFTLVITVTVFAQKKSEQKEEKPVSAPAGPVDSLSLKTYTKALDYADYEVAKNVIFTMMSKDPKNNGWLDSLVRLYYTMGAYTQCILSGTDYMSKDPGNAIILELVSSSNYSLKRYKEALEGYEKLFKITGTPYHAYQIAINQYMLKRIGECQETIQFILVDKMAEKQTVLINLTNGGSQQVPLRAAAWNLRGVIFKELGKNDDAKSAFEESLKVYPEFALAKGNLDNMKPEEKPAPKPATLPAKKPVK